MWLSVFVRCYEEEYEEYEEYEEEDEEEYEEEDGPWIDMNWPSFNAAPLMRPRVDTRRLILASLINTLALPLLPPVVDRRIDSDAAPIESDAASEP